MPRMPGAELAQGDADDAAGIRSLFGRQVQAENAHDLAGIDKPRDARRAAPAAGHAGGIFANFGRAGSTRSHAWARPV